MSKKQTRQASSPRRWDELSKQPEAKWIKIYDQNDKYDTKGTNLLVSPRIVKDFDHFVDHVNDKLKPGLGARRIYTSMGGTEVKSLDELQPNKEYTAARRRFKKRKPLSPRKNSKKGSAGSSEGYHSSEDLKTKNANGRQTLMERQALYAKKRSESEPPVSNRTKDKDDSPLFKKSPRKPKFLDVTPHNGGKKKIEKKASPAKKGATAIKATKTNPTSNKAPIKFAGAREKTPPGKKRMAFRGQYIFVSDDDDYDYDKDKDNRAGGKKGSDDDEYDDYDTDSKKPAAFASRQKNKASLKSTASAGSKVSSSLSTKSKKDSDKSEEDSDYSDDDAKGNKTAISKISKQSSNHLTARRSPSKLSSRSAGSTKSKASAGSTKSKVSAASRSSSRKPSDAGYNSDRSNKSTALNKTFNNSKKSTLSNSDDSDNDSDDSKKTSKNSDSDSDSKKSARSRLTTRKSIGGAKSRNNSNSDDSDEKKSAKSGLTTRNSNKSRNNSDSDDSDGGKSMKSRLTTKKSIAGSARSEKDSDSDKDSDSGKSTKSKLSVNRSTKSGKSKKDSDSDDGRAASRISKYSKFSKLSSKETKKKDSGSDSEEYSEYDSDNSDYDKYLSLIHI